MTAGSSLQPHAGDPDASVGDVATAGASANAQVTDSLSLVAGGTAVTGVMPAGEYRPLAEDASLTRSFGGARRIKRLTETREIRVRTTHRRRKFVARGGVLAGFGLAMVVYPIMGNVVEYHRDAAEAVPGVVLGQSPATGQALLGDGPALIPTVLDLPTPDEKSIVYTMADTAYMASTLLPNCVLPPNFDGEENGKMPADHMCLLPDGENYLRADAAQNFAQLNEQFKNKFGRDMCIVEGYRSYGDQVRIKALRGYLAAPPGWSMHGFGVAFDLCGGDDVGAPKAWLDVNAGAYGFVNPEWAQTTKHEPWHWEYLEATNQLGAYLETNAKYGDTPSVATATEPAPDTSTPVVTPQPTPAPVAPAAPATP